jgi:hypothetical protein
VNNNIKETPVTISGLTIGRLVKNIMVLFNFLPKKCIPTAEIVPIAVAITEAIVATINVLNAE